MESRIDVDECCQFVRIDLTDNVDNFHHYALLRPTMYRGVVTNATSERKEMSPPRATRKKASLATVTRVPNHAETFGINLKGGDGARPKIETEDRIIERVKDERDTAGAHHTPRSRAVPPKRDAQ
jgi:hypothetical protein